MGDCRLPRLRLPNKDIWVYLVTVMESTVAHIVSGFDRTFGASVVPAHLLKADALLLNLLLI